MPERGAPGRLGLAAWAVAAAVLLFAPERFIPGAPPPWAEAVAHGSVFAVGVWILMRALRVSWPVALGIGIVLAVGTEGAQAALPISRSASLYDALWNLCGVGVGVAGGARRREVEGPGPRRAV